MRKDAEQTDQSGAQAARQRYALTWESYAGRTLKNVKKTASAAEKCVLFFFLLLTSSNVADQARLFAVACIRLVGSFFIFVIKESLPEIINTEFAKIENVHQFPRIREIELILGVVVVFWKA